MLVKRGSVVVLVALSLFAIAAGGVTAQPGPSSGGAISVDHQGIAQQTVADKSVAQSQPNISVTIAGQHVSEAQTFTTENNPTIKVRADSSEQLELIAIRVDGETRPSFVPETNTFQKSIPLELESGSHEIKVVAKTADSTTTHTSTVVKDSTDPRMKFHAPFSTDSIYDDPKNVYTLDRSSVFLNATLHDLSGVEKVIIEKQYIYERNNEENRGDRERYKITDPGDSISQRLRLGTNATEFGPGTNYLNISVTDEFGRTRFYDIELQVRDTDKPQIEILEANLVNNRSAIQVTARATDQVGLRSVGTRVGPVRSHSLNYDFISRIPEIRPLEHTFTKTVGLSESSEAFVIAASDGAHTTKRRFPIDYESLVSPEMELDSDDIEMNDNQEVRVRGRVYNGQITRVFVESLDSTGEVIDITQVYDGDITDSVRVTEQLQTNGYSSKINLRAIDSEGDEHTHVVELEEPDPPDTKPNETFEDPKNEGTENDTEDTGDTGPSALIGLVAVLSVFVATVLVIKTK